MGIGGSVLSVLTQFLSNRPQPVLVDGCRSKLVNVVSGVSQGSVLGPLFFFLYTSELFSILENKLIGYADDYFDCCCAINCGVHIPQRFYIFKYVNIIRSYMYKQLTTFILISKLFNTCYCYM